MKMKRKIVHQLLLSEREMQQLMEMVQEASEGRTVHYSERETAPGQFFGIAIGEEHDSRNQPQFKH